MNKIVECVPNFSEGIDAKVIEAIAEAVRKTPGAKLLDVDPGQSTNRTVYTFVGDPDSVCEAALNAAKAAKPLIDMRNHKGEHPRMGALDVCPFIPIRNITVEECVELSRKFASRLALEVGVPVYLYGAASTREYRKTMPQIRSGEYEGLEEKLKDDAWAPDYGTASFVPSWGATVTGVRKFLIAYNVNMISTKEQAHRVALNLRSGGRGPTEPGKLAATQGIGWWLEEANIAQVSLNLTDLDLTPMHVAFEAAKDEARKLGLAVTGSEVVGLVPLSALLQAADYYLEKEGLMVLEEDQKVHLAVNRMGLATLSPFKPKERVIEYCLEDGSDNNLLIKKTVEAFVNSVGARTAAPGGGSVSAVLGALGCALGAMVGKLTYGKRQWEALDKKMRLLLPILHEATQDLLPLVDKDTDAFSEFMNASRLPKDTESQKIQRETAMQLGLQTAVKVPLSLALRVNKVWSTVEELAKIGNINCKSDLQVSARCLEAAVQGAVHNVHINLKDITDEQFKREHAELANDAVSTALKCRDIVLNILSHRDDSNK